MHMATLSINRYETNSRLIAIFIFFLLYSPISRSILVRIPIPMSYYITPFIKLALVLKVKVKTRAFNEAFINKLNYYFGCNRVTTTLTPFVIIFLAFVISVTEDYYKGWMVKPSFDFFP